MKYLNFTTKTIAFCALIFSITFSSCDKSDERVIPKPELSEPIAKDGKDTITLGKSITLHPKLNYGRNVHYSWNIDGESEGDEGTDSVFTFTPSARGNYNVTFKAINQGGEMSINYQIHVWGKYENGFFIVNEGWFGRGTGSVSFYRYDEKQLEDSIFTKENPNKNLEPISSTLQFGNITEDKMVLVSKVGGPVVIVDAHSFKEIKRIPAQGGSDWRAFVSVNEHQGLLSSGKGLFSIDLNTFTVGDQLSAAKGQLGDIVKAGNYIFVLSQREGVLILDASNFSVIKKVEGMQVAFARTKDGAIWAAGGKVLTKIEPKTLEITQMEVPFAINGSWMAWHPGSIAASAEDNSIYLAKNNSWSGGKEIYKFNGDVSSLQSPFIKLPDDEILYGAGIGFDNHLNQLVITTVKEGFGANFSANKLYFYDTTGKQQHSISYEGYYFPSLPVFH